MASTATQASPGAEVSVKRSESQWEIVVKRFRRHHAAMVSLFVLIVMLIVSLLAPVIAPYPRDQLDLTAQFLPPFSTDEKGEYHLFGTDHIGRDLFTRLLYAARVSLVIALVVATLSSMIGMTLGLLAGYFLGWVDTLITRTLEFISTFPTFTILLILQAILIQNPEILPIPGWFTDMIRFLTAVPQKEAVPLSLLVIILSLLGWTGTARLMRGMVLSVRELAYIESSRALGASHLRTITRHVFPNSFPPLIVDYTLTINGVLVIESALSLLGFGVQDPTPTWGNMLSIANSNMFNHPWMPLIPGIPLLIAALAVNYVGDGLRDALDPRAVIGGVGARLRREQRKNKPATAAAKNAKADASA